MSISARLPRINRRLPLEALLSLLLLPCVLGLLLPLKAWSAEAAERWLLLDAADTGRALVAVGERGSILVSQDDGGSWKRAAVPATSTLTSVCFSPDGMHGWAAGHDGLILSTADGGLSWKQSYKAADPESSFLDIAFLGEGRLLAVGAFGLALSSEDLGASWSPVRIGTGDLHMNHVLVQTDGQLLITGESGLVLQSKDGGRTWEENSTSYEGSFFGGLRTRNGKQLIHGLRGHVYLSAGDGEWTELPTPGPALLACSLQLRDGTLVLAGQARTFLVGRGDPPVLNLWKNGMTTGVACLLQTKSGDLLAFGEAGITRLPQP